MFNRLALAGVVLLLCWRGLDWWMPAAQPAPPLTPSQLRQQIWSNPADADHFLLLAEHDAAGAETLVRVGEDLAPQDIRIRLAAAAFWARRGMLDHAVRNWDRALRLYPRLGEQLYPLWLTLIEQRPAQAVLGHLVQRSAAPWWEVFFRHAADHAKSLVTVRELYHRAAALRSPPAAVWKAFLARLFDEKRWREAYFIWLDRVSRFAPDRLSNLYNGGFEAALSQSGFGWRAAATQGVELSSEFGQKVQGEKALRIGFTEVVAYQALHQYLMLPAGRYRLSGLARTVRFDGAGPRWFVRCANATDTILGQSRRFGGEQPWRGFQFEFNIPERACDVQQLRLASAPADGAISGELWFDAMGIKRLGG